MSLLGFLILSILDDRMANIRLKGMTLNDITASEDLCCKDNTVYKQLKQFIDSGYVAIGVKDGHANTYYITTSGKEILAKERSLS